MPVHDVEAGSTTLLRLTRSPRPSRPIGAIRRTFAVPAIGFLLGTMTGCLGPKLDPGGSIQPARVTLFQNQEYTSSERKYLLSAHRPTYFLATHNTKFDPAIYGSSTVFDSREAQNEEIKYQISTKFPVVQNVLGPRTDLYAGYTQQAFWQVFTDSEALSRPFREVNHEPEFFLRHYVDAEIPGGGTLEGLDLALVHQSNGQVEELSRSWNRLMGRAAVDFGDLAFVGRLWFRIPESDEDDENPNEYRYLGYGDLRAIWTQEGHTVTAMARPATEHFSFELTWSYPIGDTLRIYAQWFNGYGENLYEYDQQSNRFGIGIAVTDWLVGDR